MASSFSPFAVASLSMLLNCLLLSPCSTTAYIQTFPITSLNNANNNYNHHQLSHQRPSSKHFGLLASSSSPTLLTIGKQSVRRRRQSPLAAIPTDDSNDDKSENNDIDADHGDQDGDQDDNKTDKKSGKKRLWIFGRKKGNKRKSISQPDDNANDDLQNSSTDNNGDERESNRSSSSTNSITPLTGSDDQLDEEDQNIDRDVENNDDNDDGTTSSLKNLIEAADLISSLSTTSLSSENLDIDIDDDDDDDESETILNGEEDEEDTIFPTDSEREETTEPNETDTIAARRRFLFFGRTQRDAKTKDNGPVGSDKAKDPSTTNEPKAENPDAHELVNVPPKDRSDGPAAPKKKKKEKKTSTLRKVANSFTLLVAILLYPIVADEVGDYIVTAGSEPSAPWSRPSNEASAPATGTENSDSATGESNKNGGKGEDPSLVAEKEEDGESGKGGDGDSWKDKLPEPPRQRSMAMPNTGYPHGYNYKNGSGNSLKDRRRMALSFISEVVDEVGPSVVRIDTESVNRNSNSGYSNPLGPSYIQQGQGSGLIFSSEGFILTNAHVVDGATKVKVTLTDGRVYSCRVTGTDDFVDIAVLKIIPDDGPPMTNLPVAELGDSDKLRVGNIVIAVGCPGGLDNTVTMGIVSGRERSSMMVGIPQKLVNYIQTDAAINPGNSGGPLIDVETGRVVGINAAIRAHMEGTSFAIPINRVRDIMHDLSNGKEIKHGYLGCQLTTCTPDWARENNADRESNNNNGGSNNGSSGSNSNNNKIPEVYGALVHKIYGKSPVHLGGLREQDIIQRIGTEPVRSASDASRLIDLATPGKNLAFTILRNGSVRVISVKPKDLSSTQKELQREKQKRQQQDDRFHELGPFRTLLRD